MNGKRAKKLRHVASMIAKGQRFPDLEYQEREVIVRRRINTAVGPVVVPMKVIVKQLANCKRKVYQDLKKMYKAGEPIFD